MAGSDRGIEAGTSLMSHHQTPAEQNYPDPLTSQTPSQILDRAAGIGRLPAVGTERLLADGQDLLGRFDRLGELAGALEPFDRLLERFDLLGVVTL